MCLRDSPLSDSFVVLRRFSRFWLTLVMVRFSSKRIMESFVKLRRDFTGILFEGKNTLAGPKVIIWTWPSMSRMSRYLATELRLVWIFREISVTVIPLEFSLRSDIIFESSFW